MEAANPTGSYKDRMALAMIEADGRLRPGPLVVEYTGGSTGSSLAFVCAVKGYPLRIVSSDAFADGKIRTMRAFGRLGRLVCVPSWHSCAAGMVPTADHPPSPPMKRPSRRGTTRRLRPLGIGTRAAPDRRPGPDRRFTPAVPSYGRRR